MFKKNDLKIVWIKIEKNIIKCQEILIIKVIPIVQWNEPYYHIKFIKALHWYIGIYSRSKFGRGYCNKQNGIKLILLYNWYKKPGLDSPGLI